MGDEANAGTRRGRRGDNRNPLGNDSGGYAAGWAGRFRDSQRVLATLRWIFHHPRLTGRLVTAARALPAPTSITRLIDAVVPRGDRPGRILHAYLWRELARLYPDIANRVTRPLTLDEAAEGGIPC